jgi:hypothetical protein
MLDIAFDELPGRGAQQMLAHKRRLGVNERHHILQLITKPESAPRLVVPASSP